MSSAGLSSGPEFNSNSVHQQQSFYNNSLLIRQEIQRFESVHPSIYAIYDLLDLVQEPLAQQIREHIVCIEDSFVNSQEWTLSKSVPDLRLGIVGTLSSGKSALVHRYLTGSYMHDESPEGGRFKKEMVIDGQSYLLLIRDEGGLPEMQFSCWVDAVIFVFSVTDEQSFAAVQTYSTKMSHHRTMRDVPMMLVGTQDSVSGTMARVVDEARAKRLAADMKCTYYETCATYGYNVDKVFQEACQKVARLKPTPQSRPTTPSFGIYRNQNHSSIALNVLKSPNHQNNSSNNAQLSSHSQKVAQIVQRFSNPPQAANNRISAPPSIFDSSKPTNSDMKPVIPETPTRCFERGIDVGTSHQFLTPLTSTKDRDKDLPTPASTPTTARKTKRRSNIFPNLSSSKQKNLEEKSKNGELGSGRPIPVRQGLLYKKSQSLNKDWKKKYVTLTTDGRLTYHPTLHDYMDDVHGKEIPLKHTTVKIPGLRFRLSTFSNAENELPSDLNGLRICTPNGNDKLIPSTNPLAKEKSSVKKRHRRHKSIGGKGADNVENADGYEFTVVSLENKQWQFEAENAGEREAWVSAIEQQILNSLQGLESDKTKFNFGSAVDKATIQAIKTVTGNSKCVDCDASNPNWASLNLGALICIECSGIHRNLGTHLSKVRSLELDDWSSAQTSVMMALGNSVINKVWEARTRDKKKPSLNSKREDKEMWIRSKYEKKEFLNHLKSQIGVEQLLMEAVKSEDVIGVMTYLAHGASTQSYNNEMKTPLHIAAAKGNQAIVQLLIWHNADVRAVDSDGNTALFHAKNFTIVEDLLKQSGCTETSVTTKDSTLRRNSNFSTLTPKSAMFDKLPASII
ncbi:Centaurin-gamma-1A [Halotydeus destructor]|nr:Centaurin-gamma-1A [Halotydeus destructor]